MGMHFEFKCTGDICCVVIPVATCHFLAVSEFNKIMRKRKKNSSKYKMKGVSIWMVVQKSTQTRVVLENDIATR